MSADEDDGLGIAFIVATIGFMGIGLWFGGIVGGIIGAITGGAIVIVAAFRKEIKSLLVSDKETRSEA